MPRCSSQPDFGSKSATTYRSLGGRGLKAPQDFPTRDNQAKGRLVIARKVVHNIKFVHERKQGAELGEV